MLVFRKELLDQMVSHCLDGYPLEACGLLAGVVDGDSDCDGCRFLPDGQRGGVGTNLRGGPNGHAAGRPAAEAGGGQIVGVYHSHTHTDAKPSPTDIAQAPDPDWHYVLVSLRDAHPSVRSWRIQAGRPLRSQWFYNSDRSGQI